MCVLVKLFNRHLLLPPQTANTDEAGREEQCGYHRRIKFGHIISVYFCEAFNNSLIRQFEFPKFYASHCEDSWLGLTKTETSLCKRAPYLLHWLGKAAFEVIGSVACPFAPIKIV